MLPACERKLDSESRGGVRIQFVLLLPPHPKSNLDSRDLLLKVVMGAGLFSEAAPVELAGGPFTKKSVPLPHDVQVPPKGRAAVIDLTVLSLLLRPAGQGQAEVQGIGSLWKIPRGPPENAPLCPWSARQALGAGRGSRGPQATSLAVL